MVFLEVLKNNEGVFLVPFVKKPQGRALLGENCSNSLKSRFAQPEEQR